MKLTTLLLFLLSASVASQSACPGNGAINGYTKIADINSAISADLSAIKGGSKPNPSYVFTLCPDIVFTSNQPLTATLSGAEFVCGKSGAVSDSCVIQGGANQVLIQDPSISGYKFENVTFKGITFDGSTVSSIIANASSATTASFIDCRWSSFSGSAAVQLGSILAKAATVVISGGSVPNGTSAAIFINDNGALDISALNITGFSGANGIVTLNGGATSIQSADISGLGAGLQHVIYAEGAGTVLKVDNTRIRGITLPGGLWNGIAFAQGASGGVTGSQFLQNTGVEFAISAIDGSVVNVTDTIFDGNIAASGTYTSLYYALNNSKLFLLNDNATGNAGFYFYGFTGFQSFTGYDNTSFEGGNVTLAVFIDQDSTVDLQSINFTNVPSVACHPPQQQEFVEGVGSLCFYRGPGNCTGHCGVVKNTTSAPTSVPSPVPAAAPTIPPVVTTVAPTVSPSVAGPAPVISTKIPTSSPSLATVLPAVTVAPTFTPSAVTAVPVSISLAPSATPARTSKATAKPTQQTYITATPMPGKGKAKHHQKGLKTEKGYEAAKHSKVATKVAPAKKGKIGVGNMGMKKEQAVKAQSAYTSGKPKKTKGAVQPTATFIGKAKGVTNKKPKSVKSGEAILKAGLAKQQKAVESAPLAYGTNTAKATKSPAMKSSPIMKGGASFAYGTSTAKATKSPARQSSPIMKGGASFAYGTSTAKATKSPARQSSPIMKGGASFAYGKSTTKATKSPAMKSSPIMKGGASFAYGTKATKSSKSPAVKKAAPTVPSNITSADEESYV